MDTGGKREARSETIDPWRHGNDGRAAGRGVGGRPDRIHSEAAKGRRDFQEHSSAQGYFRQRVHVGDGVLFRLSRGGLHVVPRGRKRRQLGKIR